MDGIERAIASKDWKFLVKNFLPVNFADALSFFDAMQLVGRLSITAASEMSKDGLSADQMRDFAVNLMIILRARYPKEWESDWKNEVYLGISCALVHREEEAFSFIKNAFEKFTDPPQSLIFAFISSGDTFESYLSENEIAELTERAITKGVTYESALKMAALASEKGDQEECENWKQKAFEAERNQLHTPIITPDILKKMFVLEKGYRYED